MNGIDNGNYCVIMYDFEGVGRSLDGKIGQILAKRAKIKPQFPKIKHNITLLDMILTELGVIRVENLSKINHELPKSAANLQNQD